MAVGDSAPGASTSGNGSASNSHGGGDTVPLRPTLSTACAPAPAPLASEPSVPPLAPGPAPVYGPAQGLAAGTAHGVPVVPESAPAPAVALRMSSPPELPQPYKYKTYISGKSKLHRTIVSAFFWAVTLAYLGLFLAALILQQWQLQNLQDNPLLGPSKDTLIQLGATATYKIQGDNQWWRLLSAQFVCAGSLHIWTSSSANWTYGLFLSNLLTPYQLISVFFLSGFAGATMSANIAASYITSAASGPVFGLMGGAAAAIFLHWKLFRHQIPALGFLCLDLALNAYMGSTPFVDNACNTVGFVAGAVATLACLLMNRQSMSDSEGKESLVRVLCIGLLVAVLGISVAGVLMLLIPSTPPAQNCCNTWVCVPSMLWNCDAALADY